MKNYLSISNKIEWLLLIILKSILDYGYFYWAEVYDSREFNFDVVLSKYIFGWVLTFLVYKVLLYKKEIQIFPIFFLVFVLYILPCNIYYGLSNQKTLFLLFLITPYIIVLLSIKECSQKLIPTININKKYLLALIGLIVFIVIGNLFYSTNGNFIINFRKVYEFRALYDPLSTKGFFGYLNIWTYKVFAVFLLAFSIHKKNFIYITISLITFILLFIFTGHKSIIFSCCLIFIIYVFYIFSWNRKLMLFSFILAFIGLFIIKILFDEIHPLSYLMRRLLFVPSMLSFSYLEFFFNNDFIYWSNSILKTFFNYPYEYKYPAIIGNYLGYPGMNANSGFISTGYMHAGVWGIILYTTILSIVFNIINNLITSNNKFVTISVIIVPIYTLFVISDLPTTMLTHGLFISIILIWLYNGKNNEKI